MRIVTISTLLAATFLLTSCSYATDFVVINESDRPAEIRYKIKDFPSPFGPPVTPATITASQLSAHGAQQWKVLTSDQYHLDQGNRTVIPLQSHQLSANRTIRHALAVAEDELTRTAVMDQARRAAIEECAQIADSVLLESAMDDIAPSIASRISNRIRALIEPPPSSAQACELGHQNPNIREPESF